MFSILFRRAQATVDNAIGQAVNRAIMAVPFVVATGFATAAATSYVTRHYGAELGYLMIASAYAVVGLIAVVALRQPPQAAMDASPASASEMSDTASAASSGSETSGPTAASGATDAKSALGNIDAEMVGSAMAAAAPLAVGPLLRGLGRNLPLVLAILAAVFVLYRDKSEQTTAGAAVPGEGDGAFAPSGAI